MATAFTGSMGWTGLHPVQLGGPPLINTWTRPLSSKAVPLLAHVYENDGVTPKGTVPVLNMSSITATTANGGYDQLTLELATASTAAIYGQSIYGQAMYGAQMLQGNVVRLTEVGGPWNGFVYGGVVEDLPDSVSPTSVTHSVLLTHFGFELDDVQSSSFYTAPTDVSQIVRDAVAQTFHCSCDQVSVPPATGILAPLTTGGAVDFRNQTVKQQIDTCRSIAGPTWFWYVDELGRVWFQAMGGAAAYTVMRGPHYEQRTTSASIHDRKNRVTVIGGVPTGGSANLVGRYNGTSQLSIGIRALTPNLSVPNITDQTTLNSLAANIGTVLDRVWKKVNLAIHPPYVQRIHGSQPGGPMLRYWEPVVSSIPQSESGTGAYTGPFIVQSVAYDQLHQTVVAGDIPVTSQTDVQNMVNNLVSRMSANSLQVTAAALNLTQTLTGSFQSGIGTTVVNSQGQLVQGTLWSLNQSEFQAIDPSGVTRAEMGNLAQNGLSPAQWGFRANGADGVPLFDSVGVIGLPKRLAEVINTSAVQGTNTSFADVSGAVTSTFTLSRQSNLLVMAMGRVAAQPANTGNFVFLGLRCGSSTTTGSPSEVDAATTTVMFVPFCLFFWVTLAAGSFTAALQANAQGGVGAQWNVAYADVIVFQFGG